MKIAVPYDNGQIFPHFGHSTQFAVYEIRPDGSLTSRFITPQGAGHEAMAQTLSDEGVDALICGGIGEGAIDTLSDMGIEVCGGVSGSAEEAVGAYLRGALSYSSDANCHHHDHEQGHSCGGSCGSCGGCGGHCGAPYVETRTFTEFVELSEENFEQEVLRDSALMLIYFYRRDDAECEAMTPILDTLNAEEERVKFCRVDVEREERLSAMFAIETLPTLAVVQDRHSLTGIFGCTDEETVRLMLGCFK